MSHIRLVVFGGVFAALSCGDASDSDSPDVDAQTGTGTAADSGGAASTGGDSSGADVTDSDGGDTGSSGTATGDRPPTVEPDPSTGCGAAGLRPGVQTERTLEFDGEQRSYDLFLPGGYDGQTPLPLVLNFHGFGSNPGEQTFFSQYNDIAAAHGFAVAYPAGLDDSWNAGVCCGNSMSGDVDDVGFVRAVVAELQGAVCIDRARIYATGMSNGGFLSHRLACEASDIFAAVAPVAAVLGIEPDACTPSRVVPLHHTHGTLDQLVPYDGGGLTEAVSVPESIEGWVARNGCDPEPTVTLDADPVRCETWSGCGEHGEVVLCTAEGVGHCWPGNTLCPFGMSTTSMHASEASAEFFERHPMR